MAVNTHRIYGYISEDSYEGLQNMKENFSDDGYYMSVSRLVRLAVDEFQKKEYNDVKQLIDGD